MYSQVLHLVTLLPNGYRRQSEQLGRRFEAVVATFH